MTDEDQTFPPGVLPHAHAGLERGLGKLEGKVSGMGKSLDTLRTQTTSSFKDAAVSAKEHRDELKQEISGLSTTFNGKMDAAMIAFQKANKKQDTKIAGLERWKWGVAGGIGVMLWILNWTMNNWDSIKSLIN